MTTPTTDKTILQYLIDDEPLVNGDRRLSGYVMIRDESFLAMGFDHGNDAAKVAVLNAKSKLITVRIPTAYQPAQMVRGGTGITTYQVNGGPAFWVGDAAIQNDGDALPIGPTAQRLSDMRQREFNAATLVEALVTADYAPGHYRIALGFAIPNDEIVPVPTKGGKREDRLGVAEETQAALKYGVKNQRTEVIRTDSNNRPSTWMLEIVHLVPQAQSIGTFLIWSRTLNGTTTTDGINALTIIDIGGGDLQQTDISLNPYRMTTQRLGRGTIDIARLLKTKFEGVITSDVSAQQALITKKVRIAGRTTEIDKAVEEVIHSKGQEVIARLLPTLQQKTRFVLLTGGGVMLLRNQLLERAKAAGKEQEKDFLLINHGLSSTLNAAGALLAVLYVAAGQKAS